MDDDTQLKTLKATTEGNVGDGESTCTLLQKASNYEQVQQEVKDMTLVKCAENTYFWTYREQIKNITFEDSINIPDNAYKSWDVSETGNGKVMAYIVSNKDDLSFYDLYIQGDGEIYSNKDSRYLFHEFLNVDNIYNLSLLNTSRATNMSYMFSKTGYNSSVFKLDLGCNFDTSSVTHMTFMFFETGYLSPVFTLNLGNKFDTSNVIYMHYMFYDTGRYSNILKLDLGNKFNTAKVTDMRYMFLNTGYSSSVFTLNLGDKFDTSNVTKMEKMFNYTGYKSSAFKVDCSQWNVDKVTNHDNFSTGVSSKIIQPNWKH
ncbi:MAG: BspA family leucine-rich repeat surface protein [Firmicutes bacterium]|nr:BspA family leucine-rich repeat surface protein [Bacillota bacterium]